MNINFIGKIIEVFSTDCNIELTINDLCKRSELSYNATHRTVQDLLNKRVLNMRKLGKASIISLNKEISAGLLVMSAYEKTGNFFKDKKEIYDILSNLRQNLSNKLPNHLLSMLLIEQKTRLAEILFLVSNKDISNIIKEECGYVNEIKIKPVILTNEEFIQRKNEFQEVIAISGAENYFNIK